MKRSVLFHVAALAVILAVTAGATPAAAQEPYGSPVAEGEGSQQAGWSFTPSLAYGGSWDDNVLILGVTDDLTSDFVNSMNPRATIDFSGRRTQFSAAYDGSFLRYRDLNSINSYDQSGRVSARHLVTRHATLFGHSAVARVPTTELTDLVGVPFVRIGARVADVAGGIEWALTKRTDMSASYGLQWVSFDEDPAFGRAVLGGQGTNLSASMRHRLSARTAVSGSYGRQDATVVDGGQFTVQNVAGGAEYLWTDNVRVFGSLGLARIDATDDIGTRTSPAWEGGVSRRFEEASVDVTYGRSFIPSYGTNATVQSEQVAGRIQLPLARRVYTNGLLVWRNDQPLKTGELNLKSVWVAGALGYNVRPWIRVETFYQGTFQNIDRPGGRLRRNRVGFQIITAKPVRIR